MRSIALVLVLAAATITAIAAQEPGAVAGDAQKPTYRTGVDLVHVTVTVTDSRGHFVRGLHKDDFTVTEDGQAQPIVQFSAERAPVSIGFALDTSSSMAGAKLREAKEALLQVMNELLQAKGLISVAEDKVHVTGLKGPLEDGWQEKVDAFAARIRKVETARASGGGR